MNTTSQEIYIGLKITFLTLDSINLIQILLDEGRGGGINRERERWTKVLRLVLQTLTKCKGNTAVFLKKIASKDW